MYDYYNQCRTSYPYERQSFWQGNEVIHLTVKSHLRYCWYCINATQVVAACKRSLHVFVILSTGGGGGVGGVCSCGVSGPTLGGSPGPCRGCIPACTEAATHHPIQWLLLWAVRILLECILVTSCNEVVAKVMFLLEFVILFTGGGVCLIAWWDTPPPGTDSGIRSTSGRYASYWNAFLFNYVNGSEQGSVSFKVHIFQGRIKIAQTKKLLYI